MSACIGSGYCCWKAPCVEAAAQGVEGGGPCPFLRWTAQRHACGLLLDAEPQEAQRLKRSLAVGAGCGSALNSWRREPLKDRTVRFNADNGFFQSSGNPSAEPA